MLTLPKLRDALREPVVRVDAVSAERAGERMVAIAP
jgi:hypothetical protein